MHANRTTIAASTLIQATLGLEFILSALDKFADPRYGADFAQFIRVNPGAISGSLSVVIRAIVLPHLALSSVAIQLAELTVGLTLLVGAVELAWRGVSDRLVSAYRYQLAVSLSSALAGLAGSGLALSIALLMGEQLPSVMSVNAFTTAIPVELLLVPLGICVALFEGGRFLALRRLGQTHGTWLLRRTA